MSYMYVLSFFCYQWFEVIFSFVDVKSFMTFIMIRNVTSDKSACLIWHVLIGDNFKLLPLGWGFFYGKALFNEEWVVAQTLLYHPYTKPLVLYFKTGFLHQYNWNIVECGVLNTINLYFKGKFMCTVYVNCISLELSPFTKSFNCVVFFQIWMHQL